MSLCYWYFKPKVKEFFSREEGGVGIIEIILIIAIVVALAFLFRNQIEALFNQIFNSINPEGIGEEFSAPGASSAPQAP